MTDLNSTNGTFVDDAELVPMRTTELPVGGEVVFGKQHKNILETRKC